MVGYDNTMYLHMLYTYWSFFHAWYTPVYAYGCGTCPNMAMVWFAWDQIWCALFNVECQGVLYFMQNVRVCFISCRMSGCALFHVVMSWCALFCVGTGQHTSYFFLANRNYKTLAETLLHNVQRVQWGMIVSSPFLILYISGYFCISQDITVYLLILILSKGY